MDAEAARILEHLSAGILAAEDWAPGYQNAPKQHAALVKSGARLHRLILQHFKQVAEEIPKSIDWFQYQRAVFEQKQALQASANVQAYDVNVIVNRDAVNQQDAAFISVVFDTVASSVALGAESAAVEYAIPVPVSLVSTSEIIQNLTTEQVANLVGMKVDKKTGLIKPNTGKYIDENGIKRKYSIDETTRTRIANSIKTSIRLGENQQAAIKRMSKVIADADRAEMIAYTETVRAYAEGRHAYGRESNATGKRWSDSNAVDVCADNTAQGIIPFNDNFVSGDEYEPAHPYCKCLTSLIYGDEYQNANA